MATKKSVIMQMVELVGELPSLWKGKEITDSISSPIPSDQLENPVFNPAALQEWLEDLYFDPDRTPEFTKEEIVRIGNFIRLLMRLEPAERISAKEAASRWEGIFE